MKRSKEFIGNSIFIETLETGKRYWRWKYRFNGKHTMISMGEYGTVTEFEVREKVEKFKIAMRNGVKPDNRKDAKGLARLHEVVESMDRQINDDIENLNDNYQKIKTKLLTLQNANDEIDQILKKREDDK